MAQPVLARHGERNRRAARNPFACSVSESAAGRVDVRALDHGAHESGALRMDKPSTSRLSDQDLRRRSRSGGAMVQTGSLGVVGSSGFGRTLVALWLL